MTPPLIHFWPYALAYWIVFVWAYVPEFLLNRRTRRLPTTQDAGSFRLVMAIQGLALGAGFAIAFNSPFGRLGHQQFWFVAGLAAMVGGRLLRLHCFRMLAGSFTAVVVVKPGQEIIERGLYRWVRHPSYTAGMILFGGTMLALGNWLSVLVILCAGILAYSYRVHVEERALVETLGEPYLAYMQRTKRFVPKIL